MLQRTKTILKALRVDGAADLTNAQVKRIVESFCAAKGIAPAATLAESCASFVRHFRRDVMDSVRTRESSVAADAARDAASQTVDAEVDLGND